MAFILSIFGIDNSQETAGINDEDVAASLVEPDPLSEGEEPEFENVIEADTLVDDMAVENVMQNLFLPPAVATATDYDDSDIEDSSYESSAEWNAWI